jgi:hypothetical protein
VHLQGDRSGRLGVQQRAAQQLIGEALAGWIVVPVWMLLVHRASDCRWVIAWCTASYLISSDRWSESPSPIRQLRPGVCRTALGYVADMKLLYKPFGIVLGILAGLLSKKLFDVVWGIFDNEEPPKPTTQEADWPKVMAAAAVQGVTFKVTRAAVDRAGAKGWDHLFGVWPGEKRQEKSQASEAVR